MCGRVFIVPKEAVDQIVQDIIRMRIAEYLPDWPAVRHSGRPGDTLALIVPESLMPSHLQKADQAVPAQQDGQLAHTPSADTQTHAAFSRLQKESLQTQELQWGYEVSWNKGLIFNTKAETALRATGSNMWRDSLLNRRCVLPTFGFFETHETETFINPQTGRTNKQQYLFTLPDTPLTYIAALYEGSRFSLMTTKPNASVAPIHSRMPVVLRQEEISRWLWGDYAALFDRSSLILDVEKEPVSTLANESMSVPRSRANAELPGQESLW